MSTITVEYLKKLGACWSKAELDESAKSWPAEDARTWSWWLGDRLAELPRADQLHRVQLAATHIKAAKLRAPIAPGELVFFTKYCPPEELTAARAALGAWLDSPDDAQAFEALRAATATRPEKPQPGAASSSGATPEDKSA